MKTFFPWTTSHACTGNILSLVELWDLFEEPTEIDGDMDHCTRDCCCVENG